MIKVEDPDSDLIEENNEDDEDDYEDEYEIEKN